MLLRFISWAGLQSINCLEQRFDQTGKGGAAGQAWVASGPKESPRIWYRRESIVPYVMEDAEMAIVSLWGVSASI
jgi:hypothetical protein